MDEIELAELRMDGLDLLAKLKLEDQLTFLLYHFMGFTQQEIGMLQGVDHSTVSRRLTRITKQLTELACTK